MDKYFEFYANGKWKVLHCLTWEEAVEKSKEFGYEVREVTVHYVSRTYYPEHDTIVIKEKE